jgi:Activator of Hsp90 ATPase homolog 1-like protein
VIEVELVPDGDTTRLVVEERAFPPEEAADHGAGWQAHVEDLGAYLAGRPNTDWHTRWTAASRLPRTGTPPPLIRRDGRHPPPR